MAGFFLLLGAGTAEAQKTDSVWIRNGDRITGEVKSLSRALLKYSTDDLGTIYIEWDKVDRISSPATFEVECRSGQKYYGQLGLAVPGLVTVGADTLPLDQIVAITPIKGRLLSRLSGYLDLGFSFQQAHKTLQLTTGAQLAYRGPRTESSIEISTFLQDRDDAEQTSRMSAGTTQRLLLPNRWSTGFAVEYDRNEELDLASRITFIGFGSRTLAQSSHIDLEASAGLVLTRERYFSTDSSSTGIEGVLSAEFSAFRYDRPKLDASLTSQLFPSLSVSGRVRAQTDLRLSYELVKDFMLTGSLFHSYDSKPPSETAQKHDFGTTLSITWSF